MNGPDDLHSFLFAQRDRRGGVRVHQSSLSEEIGVPQYTISRWISKLLDRKLLKLVRREQGNIQYYAVRERQFS